MIRHAHQLCRTDISRFWPSIYHWHYLPNSLISVFRISSRPPIRPLNNSIGWSPRMALVLAYIGLRSNRLITLIIDEVVCWSRARAKASDFGAVCCRKSALTSLSRSLPSTTPQAFQHFPRGLDDTSWCSAHFVAAFMVSDVFYQIKSIISMTPIPGTARVLLALTHLDNILRMSWVVGYSLTAHRSKLLPRMNCIVTDRSGFILLRSTKPFSLTARNVG